MQRITISVDEALAAEFDTYLQARGYQSRSEGVRDLVREAVDRWSVESGDTGHCVAVLSYVFNPETRALAARLSALSHANHDLVASMTQTPLDHDNSLCSLMLKGAVTKVRALADAIRAERGVRFGALNLVAVEPGDTHHRPGDHVHHDHAHLSPRAG